MSTSPAAAAAAADAAAPAPAPTCLICLTQISVAYVPPNRPESCKCHFDVHRKCYQIWIDKSSNSYHCLICRRTTAAAGEFPLVLYAAARLNPIPLLEIPDLQQQQQQQQQQRQIAAHWPLLILLLALATAALLDYLS